MNVKYRQLVFRLVDGAVVGSFLEALSQMKLMRSRQQRCHETHSVQNSKSHKMEITVEPLSR